MVVGVGVVGILVVDEEEEVDGKELEDVEEKVVTTLDVRAEEVEEEVK